jgi:peroxiredoxin
MKSIKYIIVLLSLSAWPVVHSQNNEDTSNAQRDWEHLDYMKNFFCKAPEGCKEYDNLNILEAMRYVDRLYTNRSKLAEAFLEKYPNDPHYDQVLTLFFSSYFTPQFIPEVIESDKAEAIVKLPRKGQPGAWAKARRLMPVDKVSKSDWLDKGNVLIANILASNSTEERKAKADRLLFNRDYSLARDRYNYLIKDPNEQDFWRSFESDYFESMMLRLETLMDTYPDSESTAKYIRAVLDDIRSMSPELANTYLNRFFQKSGDTNPLSNRKGISALHKSLQENMDALAKLEVNFNEPLEMAFTAMDGTTVNLADMRGKVVLINFWSLTCPSCIASMPRLKSLYDNFKTRGFEIIGIANDGDGAKDHIIKILKNANANWPQRLDKGNEASVNLHALYGVKVLPTFWILDTKGRVVEQNVKMPQLASIIDKYLDLKNE